MRQQAAAGPFREDEEHKIRDNRCYYRNDILRCNRSHFTERIHCDWNVSEQGSAFNGRIQ